MSARKPVKLALESIEFYLRNIYNRIPFKYGSAVLLAEPVLHTRLRARGEDGRAVEGVSADALPPKWFDKDPAKDFARNIADLRQAAAIGAKNYLELGTTPKTCFDLWLEGFRRTMAGGAAAGLNGLTSSFGSSIIERAVIDAAGKLAGADFHTMARENLFGAEPGAAHPELEGRALEDCIAPAPARRLFVRHTIGMADPFYDREIPPQERVDDGLPQSLEAWIRTADVRYFKIKVSGKLEADIERLERIAALLNALAPADYRITLDGNEQFKSAEDLVTWLAHMAARPAIGGLLERAGFIEQPLDRAVALSPDSAKLFREAEGLPPVIIDESDDTLDAYARAVALGYRGVSAKNCKGVFRSLLNHMLTRYYNEICDGGYLMSGEDLTNVAAVPLQQDLCTLSVIGATHAERNGHHYYGGLSHLSPSERAACLDVHAPLYEPNHGAGMLRIRGGALDLRSLRQPGFGVGIETDFASMTPVDDWRFESLGLGT